MSLKNGKYSHNCNTAVLKFRCPKTIRTILQYIAYMYRLYTYSKENMAFTAQFYVNTYYLKD